MREGQLRRHRSKLWKPAVRVVAEYQPGAEEGMHLQLCLESACAVVACNVRYDGTS
jgi:hypothetical protein